MLCVKDNERCSMSFALRVCTSEKKIYTTHLLCFVFANFSSRRSSNSRSDRFVNYKIRTLHYFNEPLHFAGFWQHHVNVIDSSEQIQNFKLQKFLFRLCEFVCVIFLFR